MKLLKDFLRWLLRKLYKVEVEGLENYEAAGNRVLVVANHTSFLDAVLLGVFLPGDTTFAINTYIAESIWMRPFKSLVRLFPMDPANPLSIKSLIRFLQADNKVVIFPEGRITVTGSLMKIYDGTGLVADKSAATVIPVRIDGAQYTPFSRLRGQVRLRWFPEIKLTILPPQRIKPPEDIRGRTRRKYAGQLLADVMTEMMFATGNYHRTLFQAVLDAQKTNGGKHVVLEDIERRPIDYRTFITRTFVVGDLLEGMTKPGEYVGLLLPSMVSTVTVFMGLHSIGRVPAMLNYTTGAQGMIAAVETAGIRSVFTSRRFAKLAKLEQVIEQLATAVRVIYLEDLVKRIPLSSKLKAWLAARFAKSVYRQRCPACKPDDPAVVLFTSGSEGVPKGVVLSHKNLLANREQMAARIDFNASDIILNSLPLFHSFGLSSATLLPLISGVKVFFYPSPLHYRIVPEIAYDINATIMFGTNTFLTGYARFAHPFDFYSVRYVFAGAEKLQDDTRRTWGEKFGVRIFEGYGATETGPGLATNTAMENKTGTVGRLLPGITYHLEPVPGVDQGGRLEVKGPNIMLGYLLHERPGKLVPPVTERGSGWYDTGDIVDIDSFGYVTILGRAKRFAKIGGEMVSLVAVEELAASVWPEAQHAVIALADAQKGEQLVLLTTQPGPERGSLLEYARKEGIAELGVPKKLIHTERIPLMGSGKVDYQAVKALVQEELGS